jgi:ketosteroid isomerase-like protein
MNVEQQLITSFYESFRRGDWERMVDCYHEEIFFFDPVFGSLEGAQVRAMWEMLLSSARDLRLSFEKVDGDDGYGSCEWTATYTFSPTGRKVINKVRAHFFVTDGKIAEHHDDFSMWKWSAQALGVTGMLFGWTAALQHRVRNKARGSLERFIAAKKQ